MISKPEKKCLAIFEYILLNALVKELVTINKTKSIAHCSTVIRLKRILYYPLPTIVSYGHTGLVF